MSQERRLELKGRADRIRDEILSKADDGLLERLKQKGIGQIDGASLKVEGRPETGEWVRVTPTEGPISFEGPMEKEDDAAQRRSARELISDYDRAIDESGRFPTTAKAEGPKRRGRKKPTAGRSSKKRTKKPDSSGDVQAPKDDINVIRIIEKGVYEINVEKLLDDSPIIIEKDGSYLIHLPSLLESRKTRK